MRHTIHINGLTHEMTHVINCAFRKNMYLKLHWSIHPTINLVLKSVRPNRTLVDALVSSLSFHDSTNNTIMNYIENQRTKVYNISLY